MPFDMGGMGGNVGMIDLSDMMGKALGRKPTKRRKLRVPDAWDKLVEEEAEKRMDQDDVARVALINAQSNGIVFIDEIDTIAVREVRGGSAIGRTSCRERGCRTVEISGAARTLK